MKYANFTCKTINLTFIIQEVIGKMSNGSERYRLLEDQICQLFRTELNKSFSKNVKTMIRQNYAKLKETELSLHHKQILIKERIRLLERHKKEIQQQEMQLDYVKGYMKQLGIDYHDS